MQTIVTDGNGAAVHVAYAFSDLAIVYPITPSSPMAELADEWAATDKKNLFDETPRVVQMQSESGVGGALHGALTCGALASGFSCSQGLLLMLPSLYKIAGELLPTVIHVSARTLSTHALSIFGDHQDVMACRQAGFAMLAASSVQEAADFAVAAHLTALKSSVPFLHFFDGFRTSHEMQKIELLDYSELRALLAQDALENFRRRGLTPRRPVQRGTAQNPDVYFQNREAANPYYTALPQIMENVFREIEQITKRAYHVFDYYGHAQAEYVLVAMGSGACTAREVARRMAESGEPVGVILVRLYRPFSAAAFANALPKSCKRVAVLDRTKEAGALGEPLYLDVCAALAETGRADIRVFGGRYGLGSKEFSPNDCFAVFRNLQNETPKNHFTVGIYDDVSRLSLPRETPFPFALPETTECIFFGLGSDGTVGANKNTVQILGARPDVYAQAYFYYDSKKSGGLTQSHLRFGKHPISAPYRIQTADFIACHNPSYLQRYDMLSAIKEGGMFLLNAPWTTTEELSKKLPSAVKRQIAEKRLRFYVVDGTGLADEVGLNGKHSAILQAAFFYLHPTLLPYAEAKRLLLAELSEKLSKKNAELLQKNKKAVSETEKRIRKIDYPSAWAHAEEADETNASSAAAKTDEYYRKIIHPILHLQGNELPVSAFTPDGSVPTGTARLEKPGTAYYTPHWIAENCIQCNQCAFVCPHACIRPFVFTEKETPRDFLSVAANGIPNARYRIQVSPLDCKGCSLCAYTCPAKEKALVMQPAYLTAEREARHWDFALSLPSADTSVFKRNSVKGSQFSPPLFEFSYACAGCGETPYIKLLTQLFGERMLIANATGCSSIYGGSFPVCPYTINEQGQGPAWASSLFEDNAEFGYGMRLACERLGEKPPSVWLIGGDGWAYDIGFGGVDHVLASGANVNLLVLDSEVYSNTGGQASKATPLGAVARFSARGKRTPKKDLGLMAMTYGYVYVAQVSMGANKQQLLSALSEAEAYNGPSLIIAYSPCIAHGVDMRLCMEEERLAVESGYWNLYRFHPDHATPFQLDSPPPKLPLREFMQRENRFVSLRKKDADAAEALLQAAETECRKKRALYERLAAQNRD